MTITGNFTEVLTGSADATSVAPSIDAGQGVPTYFGAVFTPTTLIGGVCSPNNNGVLGCRVTPTSSPIDLSANDFLLLLGEAQRFNWVNLLDTYDQNACVIIFVDGSGNWHGYRAYANGSEITNYSTTNTTGYFNQFHNPNSINQWGWLLEKSRADISSGVIDWSDIVGIELHINIVGAAQQYSFAIGRVSTADKVLITGTEDWDSIFNWFESTRFTNAPMNYLGSGATAEFQNLANRPFYLKNPIDIGDGSTTTTINESFFSIGLQATFEDQDLGYNSLGPSVIIENERIFVINQSPNDDLYFSDGDFAAPNNWGFQIIGDSDGSCVFERVSFFRCSQFLYGHTDSVEVVFDEFYGDLTYNDGYGTFTSCIFRNAFSSSNGFTITEDADDYSNIDILFNNNDGYDITINNATGGTWNLAGISVASGYTLKVHNADTSAAVVVQIPSGITYSTSTAGGSITVDSPAITVTITFSGLQSGSEVRLYNASTGAAISGIESSGTSFSYEYEYSSDIPIYAVIHNINYKYIRLSLTLSNSNQTVPIQQQIDNTYSNP